MISCLLLSFAAAVAFHARICFPLSLASLISFIFFPKKRQMKVDVYDILYSAAFGSLLSYLHTIPYILRKTTKAFCVKKQK